jgi:hypothetical protein
MAGRANFPGNVERKQKEAQERQAAYSKLSNEEKLARLDRANLRAERERARIAYRIANTSPKK